MRFDESLREVPVDINALNSAIQQAQSQLQHVEADEQQAKSTVGLLGYLGNACRVAGRAEESMGYLERAISICRNAGDTTGEFVNTIRFAEATKYGGDCETAERLLREALAQVNRAMLSTYKDFVLQHLGKCLLEQGKGNEAIGFLEEALRLRQAKQDQALIESTQMALLDIAVHPQFQRRGIATALLQAAEDWCRANEKLKVSLRVLATNPGAEALYRRFGFVEEGRLRREFQIEGRFVDDILMAKWLE